MYRTYVGWTAGHLTTRNEEHKKADSPVDFHLQKIKLREIAQMSDVKL